MTDSIDFSRRFGSINRLYGTPGAQRIRNAHICLIGIGGVGSWCAEALARSGICQLTLIDLDHIAESNINRQAHALSCTLGQAKVTAMAERIQQINPQCQVHCIDEFLTPENISELLTHRFDFIIDACDQVKTKCALIAYSQQQKLPIIIVGAAGGKTDPSQIQITDLSGTSHDPLLANVRTYLRRQYGFPKNGREFGVMAVFSTQRVQLPKIDSPCEVTHNLEKQHLQGLSCAGYGSAMHITSSFGLWAAGHVLNLLGGAP